MCEALTLATSTLETWVKEHKFSYPPVVINITDGESTDGDPLEDAQVLRELSTQDGNVLLFNCHISGSPGDARMRRQGACGYRWLIRHFCTLGCLESRKTSDHTRSPGEFSDQDITLLDRHPFRIRL